MSEEIRQLLEKAKNAKNPERIVRKAHRIRLKKRIRLTKEEKEAYCKKCYSLKGFRKRIKNKKIVITCINCGNVRRVSL